MADPALPPRPPAKFRLPAPGVLIPLAAIDHVDRSDNDYFRWNMLILRNVGIVNFLDGCAVSLPCQEAGKAPVGLSVCGAALADRHVLAVAAAVERALEPVTKHAAAARG